MNTNLKKKSCLFVAVLFGILVQGNNGDLTPTILDYDDSNYMSPCNVWRPGDPDLNTFDLIRNYKLDQYHKELVHRVVGSNDFQTAFHIERSTNLTIESTQAFPLGIPHEFSFECTFRTKRPPTRPWHLFYLSDYTYTSQLSMTVNPLYGTIDFALPLYDGTLYTVSFVESRVFNGQWHKVLLGLTEDSVRLWIDCKPSRDEYGRERVPLENRAHIDASNGYFALAQDVRSGSTVPIDLQWMVLSCDSDKPNRTTCEELPQYDLKFKEPDEVEPESEEERPILMASAGRPRSCPEVCPAGPPGRDGYPGPPGPPGANAPPFPNYSAFHGDKGQKGNMGFPGLPGQKGEPGEVTTSGFMKELLQEFYEESQGLKGDKGEPGVDKGLLDSFVEMLKGAKGEPGVHGINGIPGLPGLKGERGESGSKLNSDLLQEIQRNLSKYILPSENNEHGEKGERGEPGFPGISGPPGLPGRPGICTCEKSTNPGQPGQPGENGNEGLQGLPGFPGLPGYPGPPGPPGPPGQPGQPSITEPKEIFHYEETQIRDICMGVVREYIAEIKSTLIGPPGATGRSIPGKTGRPGSRGPPGEPGPQGPRGERGFIGPPGLPGPNGQMGLQGTDGIKGDKGNDGICRDGLPGPQGPPGMDGQPGLDGMTGRPGPRGDPGIPGITGPQGPPGQPGVCSACPYMPYPQLYQMQQSKGPPSTKG